jgi:8-oxo-dGTP diphosphatase
MEAIDPIPLSMSAPFGGAKLALRFEDSLLVYRRDDFPDLPYPNCWDLPGGGREVKESPWECAARELFEEFALVLPPTQMTVARAYPAVTQGGLPTWLFAGWLTAADVASIRFGDEGQHWQLMPIADFVECENAIPHLRQRVARFVDEDAWGVSPSDAAPH